MDTRWVRARAPATIANVGPGFDVFSLALRGLSDEVAIRTAPADSLRVEGPGADFIPRDFRKNVAGIVIDALRDACGVSDRLEVRVRKGIPAARGLGSSAASCAAAALAFLRAFPASRSIGVKGFIEAAAEGEAAVSGRHYDNVSGALLGGFVTIASVEPLVIAREPVGPRIQLALAVPEFVLRTADMRRVLPATVPLGDAVANIGRASTLALALSRGDVDLAGRCLEDRLAEPVRSTFLPGFAQARRTALVEGATGVAFSGSGSSVFALAPDRRIAAKVARAMCAAFAAHGVRATPFATTVDNRCPFDEVGTRSGPRFSILEG